MSETSRDATREIEKELAKIGWHRPNVKLRWRGHLLLFALRHRRIGAFLLNHLEIGNLTAPDGTKYKGFRLKFRW